MTTPEYPALGSSQLRLAELLSALSLALDLTEGQPPGHCIRCCWIGMHVGRQYGLGDDAISDLFYTLLLKDLGCSSNAARICQLYLTDDLTFKRDFKTVDGSLPSALRFVLSHTGLKSGLAERFRAIIKVLQNGGELARELIETRCHRGAEIARTMHFSDAVAKGILNLDEHWDGSGQPSKKTGREIPIASQIALLSQVVDVFQIQSGSDAAIREIGNRSGLWFDPDIVSAFCAVAKDSGFWQALNDDDLQQTIYELEPAQKIRVVDEDHLDDIASGFAQVIDSKSPYTSGHSERVTVFTDLIAEQMGFDADRRRTLKRAALLHDIGKLGVSNTVLDKPGKLDDEEWEQIRLHPVYSESILSNISVFADLAPIAGGHHERLDGKGYPRGLAGDAICLETRIVTVADIFDALTAERPYRDAMPISKALAIMGNDVGTAIDPGCFYALKSAINSLEESEAA